MVFCCGSPDPYPTKRRDPFSPSLAAPEMGSSGKGAGKGAVKQPQRLVAEGMRSNQPRRAALDPHVPCHMPAQAGERSQPLVWAGENHASA